jgi:hypothetical protein
MLPRLFAAWLLVAIGLVLLDAAALSHAGVPVRLSVTWAVSMAG